MLVNLNEVLTDAAAHNYAIGSFNTPNLVTLRAVIAAAEELGSPVIINHAEGHDDIAPIEMIGPMMVEFAARAKVPVCPHIDHGVSMPFVMKAVRAGFTSIMYDCSRLPFEENVAQVKRFIELVRPLGITVEAELGEMPSCEGSAEPGSEAERIESLFTDPDQAVRFAELTECDALAISFGTIHGMHRKAQRLDVERVAEIKRRIRPETALVMHGGSSAEEAQTRSAIAAGINKVNYFTALDVSPTETLTRMLLEAGGRPFNFTLLANEAMGIIKEKCKRAIELFHG